MNPSVLLLADGRFPAGGHAYSAGVEAAVAFGDVADSTTLERYLEGRLATTGVTESAFAVATWGAVRASEARWNAAFDRLDAELDARICAPGLRDVSRRLGRQMLRSGRRVWPHSALDELAASPMAAAGGPHQPIVVGALAAVMNAAVTDVALVVMHQLAGAVTTAAVRLLGLDPVTVAAVHANTGAFVETLIEDAPRWAVCDPAELPAHGGALTEILGQDHATWPARLFVA